MINNMELWNSVCESDPKTLKRVQQRGGFTAIAAQSQIKRATELWGPYGYRWGLRGLDWGTIESTTTEGINVESLTLEAEFFFPVGDEEASFEIAGDIPWSPKDECHKKLQTDITTKALSKVGFNADVFLDQMKWDGNRYVNPTKQAAPTPVPEDARRANFLKAIESSGAGQEMIVRLLGVHGFESLDEITSTENRKMFIAAIRTEVAKNANI